MLIKTTLSVNFDHEHAGVLEDPAVPKTWTVLKRNARSVGRKKQSKSPWIRGTTSVSHSEGSVHDWCVFSRDRTRPTSSVNAKKFKLACSSLSHRCLESFAVCSGVASFIQTRGSEESRLPNKIRERADLQHYITSTTVFFMTRGLSPFDFLGCCAKYFSHRAQQKLLTVLSPASKDEKR